jgi:hypothetical protein
MKAITNEEMAELYNSYRLKQWKKDRVEFFNDFRPGINPSKGHWMQIIDISIILLAICLTVGILIGEILYCLLFWPVIVILAFCLVVYCYRPVGYFSYKCLRDAGQLKPNPISSINEIPSDKTWILAEALYDKVHAEGTSVCSMLKICIAFSKVLASDALCDLVEDCEQRIERCEATMRCIEFFKTLRESDMNISSDAIVEASKTSLGIINAAWEFAEETNDGINTACQEAKI